MVQLPARVLGYLVVMEAILAEELAEEEQLVRRHRKEKKELQGDQGVGSVPDPGKGAWRVGSVES